VKEPLIEIATKTTIAATTTTIKVKLTTVHKKEIYTKQFHISMHKLVNWHPYNSLIKFMNKHDVQTEARHYSSFNSNVGLYLQYNTSGFDITEILTVTLKNTGNQNSEITYPHISFLQSITCIVQ
jgi:hypothetical protein